MAIAEVELAYHIGFWDMDSLVQTLTAVSRAGWRGVEPTDAVIALFEDRPAVLHEMLREERLLFAGLDGAIRSLNPETFEEEVERQVRAARFVAQLEASLLVLRAPPPPADLPSAIAWSLLAEMLNQIGESAAKLDVQVALLPGFGTFVASRAEVERLLEKTNSRLVRLSLDTGHLAGLGLSPVSFYEKHRRRIAHLRLRDVREPSKARASRQAGLAASERDDPHPAGLGDGAGHLNEFLRFLGTEGYEGWLTVLNPAAAANLGEIAAADYRRLEKLLEKTINKGAKSARETQKKDRRR